MDHQTRRGNDYFVRSETNQRTNNEDSFLLFDLVPVPGGEPVHVLALADGMGGHAHGEHVSQEGLRKISLSLFEQAVIGPALNRPEAQAPPDTRRMADILWGALQQTNHHVRRMVENNRWDKAGSTLVIAAVIEDRVAAINLGDSPLFHYRAEREQLSQITEDHTVTGALLRGGVISTEMARHHEGRSKLEFYLGCDSLPPQPPVHRLALDPGDLLLLCSDGVSGSLKPDQIRDILADPAGDLARMADQLIAAGRAADETDNQTLILWRHTRPPQDRFSMPTESMNQADIAAMMKGR